MNKLKFIFYQLKPKGRLLTPFNIITAPIIFLGLLLIAYRFIKGISVISDSSQTSPWGLLIGFNVITGVPLGACGYIIAFVVYILGLKRYYPLVRPAILIALVGYIFYGSALLIDLGRPLHIINPIIGNSFGVSSILFIVAWKFFLYIVCLSLEFSPVVAEWLSLEKTKGFLIKLIIPSVIIGITLSIIHQSALGALFLLAPLKLHPLWYPHISLSFFISSIFSGIAMLLIIGWIYYNACYIELGKACAITMFVYLFLKLIDIVHSGNWQYLQTPFGYLYLVELGGFVLVPMIMFVIGVKRKWLPLIKIASIITILGIILNRINVSMTAFNYQMPKHFPGWMECVVSISIILIEIWVFRFLVNRMPVLREENGRL